MLTPASHRSGREERRTLTLEFGDRKFRPDAERHFRGSTGLLRQMTRSTYSAFGVVLSPTICQPSTT